MGKATLTLEIEGRSDMAVRSILLEVARTLDQIAQETKASVQRVYVELPKEPGRKGGGA